MGGLPLLLLRLFCSFHNDREAQFLADIFLPQFSPESVKVDDMHQLLEKSSLAAFGDTVKLPKKDDPLKTNAIKMQLLAHRASSSLTHVVLLSQQNYLVSAFAQH